MFNSTLVVGAGSAGLLVALSFRRHLPRMTVRVVRSREIGTIGVGESTTPNVPEFLFEYLQLNRRDFFKLVEPTWKLGLHLLWGPRPFFDYPFDHQMDVRQANLPRQNGYYCDTDFTAVSVSTALMNQGKAFPRRQDGLPAFTHPYAFHLENAKFVAALETMAMQTGIEFIDGTINGVETGPEGISAVVLDDSRKLTADFFVDASGFRRELLGNALKEPFISFDQSLFNDRAILGSWDRTDEPILPYTIAETMNCGWAWQIDHEHKINRGYVYSSSDISDDAARGEFAVKNPGAKISDRIVRFKTGRLARAWVGNVMALGNACGFVEPLEASALMMVCWQCRVLTDMVQYVGPTAGVRDLFNRRWAGTWDDLRDFLTLHFKINTRLDTPYWKRCREEADASRLADLLEFYYECGPTGYNRFNRSNTESQFGIEGYLTQLVGNRVPHRNPHRPTSPELVIFDQLRQKNRAIASKGLTVKECLAYIHHPNWPWFGEAAKNAPVR